MTSHKIACQYCNKPLTVHYPDSTRIKCNITNRQKGPVKLRKIYDLN